MSCNLKKYFQSINLVLIFPQIKIAFYFTFEFQKTMQKMGNYLSKTQLNTTEFRMQKEFLEFLRKRQLKKLPISEICQL